MTRPVATQVITLSALSRRESIGPTPPLARWGLESLAGRLSELSGIGATARLSLAVGLVCEAQHTGEVAVWVTNRRNTFFPPDATQSGADLNRLPVVFTPDAPAAARAAWRLVQSGGFGLVVLDLVGTVAEVPIPLQSRLTSAAQAHGAAVVFVTEKPADRPSLGSLVSLRCEARRETVGAGRFLCIARALKDKRRGPGWTYTEARHGPAGLR
jgi:recombination protein RecA